MTVWLHFGGDLDIIVNAHGIQRRHSAEVFPIEEWDEVPQCKLKFCIHSLPGSCKDHVEEGIWKDHQHRIYGILVWRTDCSGLHSSKGRRDTAHQGTFSNDWIARGVNVNAIAPGYMATEMNSRAV